MPPFANNAFHRPQLVQKGTPAYMFGSFSQQVGNTKFAVAQDEIVADVATVEGQLLNGPLPAVGSLLSIINTTNSAGAFNVNRVPITAVTYTAATNVMQVTFPLTETAQALTADGGTAYIEPAEVGEAVAAGASQVVMVQAPSGDSQFTLPFAVTFTTLPTAATVTLQRALNGHNENEWTPTAAVVTVAAGAYTAGPVIEATLERGYVYRALVSGLTAGPGTGIVAKIGG
jgi:hypothetical protein